MLRLLHLLIIGTIALSAGVAVGAPADIDRGFGREGRVVMDFGGSDEVYGVAAQPDGKVVVVGDTSNKSDIVVGGSTDAADDGVVWRVNGNGTRDQGFGQDGELVVAGAGLEEVMGVAVQPDGKIALAGVKEGQNTDALLYRLLGGAGRDRLIGGPGRDRLIGGPGRDRVR